MNPEIKKYLQDMQYHSDDPDRQTAALVTDRYGKVVAMASNTIPSFINKTHDRIQKPSKYKYIEHAERNVIYLAAQRGFRLEKGSMYCTLFPCVDCARAIIQAGLVALHCPAPDLTDPKWGEDFKIAKTILEEAEIIINFITFEEGIGCKNYS